MYAFDWLAKRADLTPNKVALVDAATGREFTYAQFNERASRFAEFLRNQCNIQSGDRVAVLAHNSSDYFEMLYGSAKIGAILVPLNWRLAAPELTYMLDDCAARVLIAGPEFADTARDLQGQVPFETLILLDNVHPMEGENVVHYDELLSHADTFPATEEVNPEDSHLILYTSGTTGRPKGAILPHRVMVWNSLNTNVCWDLHADDVSIIHMPLFHTGGINVLTIPIFHVGGTMVLMREWDPVRCLQLIEQEHVTIFFAVPTMFQMMLETPGFERANLSSMRFCISGGAPCPVPVINAYQARGVPFRQGYGLTEVSVNCFVLEADDAVRKAGSIGRPIFHLDTRIVGSDGKDVALGEIGELWLRGPTVCAGYWNNPEATAQSITDGWFHTGDLATMDTEGFYYIVDRKKDMYISGGENVYPAEVEGVLYDHPAIAECAVIGVPHPKWGEVGRAVVVVRPGISLTEEEIISHCHERLGRFKVPRSVVFVPELPHTPSGKVRKPELRERYGQ
jgi:fatty-acyl-CoA synthase